MDLGLASEAATDAHPTAQSTGFQFAQLRAAVNAPSNSLPHRFTDRTRKTTFRGLGADPKTPSVNTFLRSDHPPPLKRMRIGSQHSASTSFNSKQNAHQFSEAASPLTVEPERPRQNTQIWDIFGRSPLSPHPSATHAFISPVGHPRPTLTTLQRATAPETPTRRRYAASPSWFRKLNQNLTLTPTRDLIFRSTRKLTLNPTSNLIFSSTADTVFTPASDIVFSPARKLVFGRTSDPSVGSLKHNFEGSASPSLLKPAVPFIVKMVGKKSGRALQLEEGLERTDNGMKQTSWPEIGMINQKNYYTEYMKRDDQILPLRLQAEASRDRMIRNAKDRDRALARTGNTDVPGPVLDDGDFGVDDAGTGAGDGFDASKVIVIHPGSQNMRIGFASDALPKTLPMVSALKWRITESEQNEPRPRRQNISGTPEQQFGDEFAKKFTKQCNDLKIDMRANKRKILPNSKELVVNYNRRTPAEEIPEHNDPVRIEWTDYSRDTSFTGLAAQRIPDDSDPKFKLFWPIQNGWLNEHDFRSRELLTLSLCYVIEEALRNELGLDSSSLWKQYSCVMVIPDLYDKTYVQELFDLAMKTYEFAKVCFIQESLAASFGAGYSNACIVDVGAQKTSICCVEDGMCVEDSRINLKYGGYDVTETFIKMMLCDHFPYQDINLMRRYDFLLAEELKIKFCTLNQADISVQLYNFHLRAPSEYTRKYQFKTYDEVILAPMGFYDPSIFDNSSKLKGRRNLMDRSYNVYDPDMPDDPISAAQIAILTGIKPSLAISNIMPSNNDVSTPAKEKPQPFNLLSRLDSDILGNGTPGTSTAGSPAPEGSNTPNPGGNGNGNGGSPGPSTVYQFGNGSPAPPSSMFIKSPKEIAAERDSVLPIAPLDQAIITSIHHAAKGDEKKLRDLFGGIMVIGGGAKTPGFGPFLEERLKLKRPDLAEKILVGTSPREMDGQVVVWKGASVFGKLTGTNDTWITPLEYERLNSRVLHHKVAFNY